MARVTINEQVSRVVGLSPGPQGPTGPTGPEGPVGETGQDGSDGVGVPTGGTTGQVLTKATASNFDTTWAIPPSGILETVAGGAGFVDASGDVTMDLSLGRAFHQTMTGNITSLVFSNVPTATESAASWVWVLKINATGGYILSSTPTVTWTDGRSWSSLNLAANAVNVVVFTQQGSVTYATLVWNGTVDLALPDIMFDFPAAGTIKTVIRTPCTLDVANAEVDGAGTVTYEKNGVAITIATAFVAGDTFEVTAALGQSVTVGVSA